MRRTLHTILIAFTLAVLTAVYPAPTPAHAFTHDEVTCVRIARALAHGSVRERTEAAELWRAEPAAVVVPCRAQLVQAFQADARRFADRQPEDLWRSENLLLAHLLRTVDTRSAADWLPILDPDALPVAELGSVARHWMSAAEPAVEEAFQLLAQVDDEMVRGNVMHGLLPRILDLETESVTAATRVLNGLEKIGAGRLLTDRTTGALWPISPAPRPHDAEAALLGGDVNQAFHLYSRAAARDRRYLYHTAILAEQLFQTEELEPIHLIPLQISYSLCERTYRVDQGLGAIYRLRTNTRDRELAAEMLKWLDWRCGDHRDPVERAAALTRTLRQRYPGTRAAIRQLLIQAETLAARADELAAAGRSGPANDIRREALALVEDPARFRFPGGATQARALRHHLLSELPPDLN